MEVVQKFKNLFKGKNSETDVKFEDKPDVSLDDKEIKKNENLQKFLETYSKPCKVKTLTVNGTAITSIPQYIGAFSNVVKLNFYGNRIEFIPWSIALLTNLQDLNLSMNCIREIPLVMCHLQNLRTLDLSCNNLIKLPTDLLNLENLKVLNVEGNADIASPSWSVCSKGKDAIFEALKIRTERSNKWANWKPYYQGEFTCMKTLVALCIDCIIESKVDFLSATTIPPTVKNYLSVTETQERTNLPQLFKCSNCSRYFSKPHLFDNHDCQYIGKAKTRN